MTRNGASSSAIFFRYFRPEIDSILRSLGISDFGTYCGQELYRFWQGTNEFCSVSP